MQGVSRLLTNIETLSKQRRMRIGSLCSGSDIAFLAIRDIFAYYKSRHDMQVSPPEHTYSCENVEFKQAWILKHFTPKFLFNNLLTLAKDSAGFDLVSEEEQRLTAVDGLIAGFECDSISGLNADAANNRDAVVTGDGKTGSTAKATLAIVADTLPAWVILENVRNLQTKGPDGKSNLQKLIETFNTLGYACKAMLLNALPFGSPSRRERWYIVAVRVSSDPLDQEHANPQILSEMVAIVDSMKILTMDLKEFLLPEGHDVLLQKMADESESADKVALAARTKKAKPEKRTKKPAQSKSQAEDSLDQVAGVASWMQDHMEAYETCKYPWPPDLSGIPSHLPQRQQELVWLYNKLCPAGGRRIDDINMTVFFGSPGQDVLPCIVSTCTMWYIDESLKISRELHGLELMAVQGWHYSENQMAETTHEQLKDLAGNAFCAFTVVPVILALFSILDFTRLREWVDTPATAEVVSNAVPLSEDEEGEEGEESEAVFESDGFSAETVSEDDLDGMMDL